MLKITLLFLFLLVSSISFSQFFEDFENGVPGTMSQEFLINDISWNTNCYYGTRDSSGGAPCPLKGFYSASFWDWGGGTTALRTPVLDLSSGMYRLEFQHVQRAFIGDATNFLYVDISIDAGATWTEIIIYDTEIPFPKRESIDLASYNPTNETMIQFRGELSSGYALILDEISITPIPNFDVKMDAVTIEPITTDVQIPVTGSFRNNGLNVVQSVVINWQIEGQNTVYTQLVDNLNLAAGESYTYIHSDIWNTIPGVEKIKVWLSNLNGGNNDENPSNDFLKVKVNVANGVVAKQRVLYEEFTSSTCGPCQYFNDIFFNEEFLAINADNISVIKYQMNWPAPGDPYYTDEGGVRKEYYGISGVPSLKLEGETGWFYQNDPAFLQLELDEAILKPAYFTIDASHDLGLNGQLDLNVSILPNIGDMYLVHVAVIENECFDNAASNGETSFNNVMMKMLPDAEGTLVSFTPGETETLEFSVNVSETFVEEIEDLEVVVFIQSNDYYKTVMQSQISSLGTLGVTDNSVSNVYIYPNPSSGILKIATVEPVNLQIIDIHGKTLITATRMTNEVTLDVSKLGSGIYFVNIVDGSLTQTRKLIIE